MEQLCHQTYSTAFTQVDSNLSREISPYTEKIIEVFNSHEAQNKTAKVLNFSTHSSTYG